MNKYSPDLVHKRLLEQKPLLAFDESDNYSEWKISLRDRLIKLLGDMPNCGDLNFRLINSSECDKYKTIRFEFDSEPDVRVPAWLLIPNGKTGKFPVIICLQGHSSGAHISLGECKYDGDVAFISDGDRDFALQAVSQGYCALVIEQRCFGDRRTDVTEDFGYRCFFPSASALMLGRTMIGERVLDVMRAIDALDNFDCVDKRKIACMGNSGGGTISYYAACLDERIKVVMPSCSVCTFKKSIGAMYHCICNYIPGIAKYMDMSDMSALIAPRPLIVVAGEKDPIFPIEGVRECFMGIQKIYKKENCELSCKLVEGGGGHRFYAEQAWRAFNEIVKTKLDW